MKRSFTFLIFISILALILGCSGGSNDPVTPETESQDLSLTGQDSGTVELPNEGHLLLGFGELILDPDEETLEIVPMRTSEFHLNMVKFVESAPFGLTIDGPLSIEDGLLKLNLAIKHPLPGMVEFSVFDMKLVFITEFTVSGFSDPDLTIAGLGAARLENADGWTRYWNPAEFIQPGFRGYTPGALGLNLDPAKTGILNGYKLYADGLAPTDPLADLDLASRAMTLAGNSNSRYCELAIGTSFIFNYAIDACWDLSYPSPPVNLPDDFPILANQAEPWWIDVEEVNNTLWFEDWDFGGNANYEITVHDWQGSDDFGTVTVESPGLFTLTSDTPESTTENTATYHFDVILPELASSDDIDVLISVGVPGDYDSALTGVTKPLKAYHRITCEVSDEDPVFNVPPVPVMFATTDTEIMSGESVSFDASDSYDPDGVIEDYEWDFNGDGFFNDTFTGDPATPTHVFDTPGVFQAKVKVTDNSSGAVVSDPVEISVENSENENPVAICEATTMTHIIEGGTVSFDGSDSYDPDGSIVNWKWDFNQDGDYNDTYAGDAATPTATFNTPGTFMVDMMARDNEGAFDTLDPGEKIEIVVVEAENIPPEAVAEATTTTSIFEDGTVTFDATASNDPDGTVVEWRWDFNGDGNYNDTFAGSMENPTATFGTVGTFLVDLMVYDNSGGWDTLETKIQVDVAEKPNEPPFALAHATTATEIGGCSTVSFDAWDSYDPDGTIAGYYWDFNGDGTFGDSYQGGSIKNPVVEFTTGGVFEVQLKVIDNDSAEDLLDAPIIVTVSNIGPEANAAATTATTIFASETVTFDASSSVDPDCDDIIAYDWDFDGDGVYGDAYDSGTDINPTKAFMVIDTYDVTVRVTDASAATDDSDPPIVITVENHPPIACAEITDDWPYMWEEDHHFSAACSEDPGGSIVLYEWDLNADNSWEQTGPTATYYFPTVGDYVIQLRVTDDLGATAVLDEALSFYIYDDTNIPPIIQSVNHSRTTSYTTGEPVILDVDFIDPIPVGDTHTYLWECPYGSFDNDESATPTWTPPTYDTDCDITVTITDLGGTGLSGQGTCHQWVVDYQVIGGNPNAPNGTDMPAGLLTDYFTAEVFEITDYPFPGTSPNGNVVYINIWASWCPPCKNELPHLMQIYQNWHTEDFVHIQLSVDSDINALNTYMGQHPEYNVDSVTHWVHAISYWYLLNDWQSPEYQNSIPQHYIFDRDGRLRYVGLGGISGPTVYDTLLGQLL